MAEFVSKVSIYKRKRGGRGIKKTSSPNWCTMADFTFLFWELGCWPRFLEPFHDNLVELSVASSLFGRQSQRKAQYTKRSEDKLLKSDRFKTDCKIDFVRSSRWHQTCMSSSFVAVSINVKNNEERINWSYHKVSLTSLLCPRRWGTFRQTKVDRHWKPLFAFLQVS